MLNILGLIPTALAQNQAPQVINVSPADNSQFINFDNFTIGGIISTAITMILIVAGVVFLFMLIVGGIRWIMSGGDKAQAEGARNQITAALIGLVIVFAAYAIATLIGSIFGIDILNFTTPQVPVTAG